MRCGYLLLCSFCSLLVVAPTMAQQFPFVAYVVTDQATIRSGPGEQFYATSELLWGDQVNVFATDVNGWLAIRPPQGSYSWVAAEKLVPTDQLDVAVVAENDVAARIGSELGQKWDVAQVRLEQGELVELLGSEQIGDQSWYMIEPPRGEFRWVHADQVDRRRPQLDETTEQKVAPAVSIADEIDLNTIAPPVLADSFADPQEQTDPLPGGDYDVEQAAWTPRRPRNGDRQSATKVDRKRTSIVTRPVERSRTQTVASPWSARQTDNVRLSQPDSKEDQVVSKNTAVSDSWFDEQMMVINVEFSRAVSGDPSNWQLDELRQRVRRLADQGNTPRDRAQARLLMENIAEFDDVRLRHEQQVGVAPIGSAAVPVQPPFDRRLREPIGTEFTASSAVSTSPNTSSQSPYDGNGWLMPVVTRRPGVPRFALTDDYGRILQFVSPAPGLNLQRYLRQQIGVTGKRSLQPKFDRPHLTAERVVVLDRHRR